MIIFQDICIPVPEPFEESTSESDESGEIVDLTGDYVTENLEDKVDLTEDFVHVKDKVELAENYVTENIEEHLKNEILTLIDNIGQEADQKSDEYLDVDEGSDCQSSGDIEGKKNEDYVEAESDVAKEQLEGEEAIALEQDKNEATNGAENDEKEQLSKYVVPEDTDVKNEDFEGPEINDDVEETKDEDILLIENKDDATFELREDVDEKVDEKGDEYLESEDIAPPLDEVLVPPEITDDITETFADATEDNEAEDNLTPSEEIDDNALPPQEIDRKVTFDETGIGYCLFKMLFKKYFIIIHF